MWLKDEGYHTTVESAWDDTFFSLSPISVVGKNLENYQRKLHLWSKASLGNIIWDLENKMRQLKIAERDVVQGGDGQWVHVLKVEVRDLLTTKE